jgi:thiamine-phosphate diphosphorylase
VLDGRAARDDVVERTAEAGADWFQLRDRSLEAAALLELADRVRDAARRGARRAGRTVQVLVNRRLDVALAAACDGVHLGFDAMPAATARGLLGPDALIGVSCHEPAEVKSAEGASYAHLAPVFAPLSKAATRPAVGLEGLRHAARGTRPVLAQGGVTPDNAGACIEAGAAGVAVIGAVLGAPDPVEATRALRRALDAAAGAPR